MKELLPNDSGIISTIWKQILQEESKDDEFNNFFKIMKSKISLISPENKLPVTIILVNSLTKIMGDFNKLVKENDEKFISSFKADFFLENLSKNKEDIISKLVILQEFTMNIVPTEFKIKKNNDIEFNDKLFQLCLNFFENYIFNKENNSNNSKNDQIQNKLISIINSFLGFLIYICDKNKLEILKKEKFVEKLLNYEANQNLNIFSADKFTFFICEKLFSIEKEFFELKIQKNLLIFFDIFYDNYNNKFDEKKSLTYEEIQGNIKFKLIDFEIFYQIYENFLIVNHETKKLSLNIEKVKEISKIYESYFKKIIFFNNNLILFLKKDFIFSESTLQIVDILIDKLMDNLYLMTISKKILINEEIVLKCLCILMCNYPTLTPYILFKKTLIIPEKLKEILIKIPGKIPDNLLDFAIKYNPFFKNFFEVLLTKTLPLCNYSFSNISSLNQLSAYIGKYLLLYSKILC